MINKLFTPFINSLPVVLKEMAGIDVKMDKAVSEELNEIHTLGVTSIISFTGKIKGRVMLDMEASLAKAIAENVTSLVYKNEKDLIVLAAISEVNNIIAGKAIAPLNNELGLKLWMSPPYVFAGKDIIICIPKLSSASLNYSTVNGKFRLNIAFEKES